jgi:hypothetical protein
MNYHGPAYYPRIETLWGEDLKQRAGAVRFNLIDRKPSSPSLFRSMYFWCQASIKETFLR